MSLYSVITMNQYKISLVGGFRLMSFLYVCSIEWIFIQNCSGLVHCFSSDYPFIYYVVQKELPYFMPRLPPDVLCL